MTVRVCLYENDQTTLRERLDVIRPTQAHTQAPSRRVDISQFENAPPVLNAREAQREGDVLKWAVKEPADFDEQVQQLLQPGARPGALVLTCHGCGCIESRSGCGCVESRSGTSK